MALPKVTQYIRNVGKSIAFTAIDAVKDNANGINEFASANETIFKEVYSGVKNYRRTVRDAGRKLTKSKVFEAVNAGVKNLIEDAKTGNFYNEARLHELGGAALGLEMDDWDWDDDDYSISSSSDDSPAPDPVASAVNASGISQNVAIAQSTGIMVENSQNNTKLILAELGTFSDRMSSGFGTVYTGINKVNNYLENQLQSHLENSKTYYENSLKIFQESQAMLKELVEMQRGIYAEKEKKKKEDMLSESMTANGGIDFAGYAKNLKKNFNNILDETGLSMFNMDMGEGTNPLLLMAANPFSYILGPMVNKALSSDFKKSLKSFDKGITSMFSQIIAKMNTARSKSGGGIWEWVGKLFGIEIDKKDSINTANYKKGPVPFDGITKQTIVEVIPGYLARIEAALTGKEERYYDAHNGKWKLSSDIKKELNQQTSSIIASANYDIRSDLAPLINQLKEQNAEAAKSFESSVDAMINRIFKDGGDFRPNVTANSEFSGYKDAWKYYGFKSEAEFRTAMQYLSRNTIRDIAQNNMEARQRLSRNFRDHEENNGIYRLLYNDALSDRIVNQNTRDSAGNIINGSSGTVNTRGTGLLASSLDEHNKNIFYYLQEILGIMKYRRTPPKKAQGTINGTDNGRRVNVRNRAHSTSADSIASEATGTDGEPPSDEEAERDRVFNWDKVKKDKEKEQEEKRKKKQQDLKDWIDGKFGDSPVGQGIAKLLNKAVNILDTPMKYATKLLNKADENMFQLMFGNNSYRNQVDENGEPITSVFDFMVYKVKTTFKEASEWIKKQFNSLADQIKKFFSPIWEKYFKPVKDQAGDLFKQGFNRAKQGLNRTFGRGFRKLMGRETEEDRTGVAPEYTGPSDAEIYLNRMANNGVVSLSDIFNMGDELIPRGAEKPEKQNSNNVELSAAGRLVTKRGLTMISPGEMIIPATFNRNEQNKMLQAEKRDRDLITKALSVKNISLNARGTVVDQAQLRERLNRIYQENMSGNMAQVGAGGLLGAGAGLLTLGNPLLGALAGAGLSILKNSETFQNIIFGERAMDENGQKTGDRQGGVIPKKVIDIFKSYGSDIIDFGIAGGALGLISPFGILGTAAIGAGVGYLKNTDTFKTFLFGDGTFDNQGLVDKEEFDKAVGFVKKAVPAMAVGAVGGALLGPFGLVGNAALGAGIGLLSTTSGFKEFLFGNKDKKKRGLVHAIQDGILKPATEQIAKLLIDFKNYAKKWILEPLKEFWSPVKQMMQNVISSTFTRVGDFLNKMFEKSIGVPIQDFLQEKVFKPITKTLFTILKAPYTLAKGVVAAPFQVLKYAGRAMTTAQIQRGTATNMHAQERLDHGAVHPVMHTSGLLGRFIGGSLGRTPQEALAKANEMRRQDEMIANMSDEQVAEFAALSADRKTIKKDLANKLKTDREEMGNIISNFMNTADESGESNYDKIARSSNGLFKGGQGFKLQKQISKALAEGDLDGAKSIIKRMSGISDDQKNSLISQINEKFTSYDDSRRRYQDSRINDEELRAQLSQFFGREIKDSKDFENLKRMFVTEDKYRKGEAEKAAKSSEKEDTDTSTPQGAVNQLAEDYRKRADEQLDLLAQINSTLISIHMGNNDDSLSRTMSNFDGFTGLVSTEDRNERLKEYIRTINPTLFERLYGEKETNDKKATDQNTGTVTNAEAGSKEEADNRDIVEARDRVEEEETEETRETNNILTKIKEGIIGKTRKVKESIADKMGLAHEGFGKLLGFLGLGGRYLGKFGKYALMLGGVSIFGHLTNWFKEKVWPMFSAGLFGRDVNGQTENLGLAYSIGQALNGPFMKIKEYLESEGGLQGLFLNKLLPRFLEGLQFTVDNVVAPATQAILVALPDILKGLAKSLVKGIGDALASVLGSIWPFGNKDKKEKERGFVVSNGTQIDTSALDSVYPTTTNSNVDLSKYGVTAGYGSTFDYLDDNAAAANGYAKAMSVVDGTSNSSSQKLVIQQGNKIESDSNSFVGAMGRNAVMGLAGLNSPMSKVFGAINKGSQFTRRIPFLGTASRVVGAGAKGAQGLLDISNGFGKGIRNFGKAVATAEDATRTAAKVTSKVATAFEKLANSKVATLIIKAISKMTGGKVTQEAVALAFKKIGKSLGKKLVNGVAAKALGKIAAKLAAWPIWIAMCVVDFGIGYKDAYSILGVSKGNYTCSFAERVACGLVNLINQQLSLGLIPTSTIMDIIIEHIYPLFGLDKDSLMAARAAGDQIVDGIDELKEQEFKEKKQNLVDNIEKYYQTNGLLGDTVNGLTNNIANSSTKGELFVNNYIWGQFKNEAGSEAMVDSNMQDYGADGRHGSGRGRRLFGRGHTYQKDPRISGLPYGDSTMGESGCGPVAAANLVNKFNGGVSPLDAAAYAESHGMTTPGGGTDMSFFNSFLGSQGIPTTNTNSKASALNAIGQGNPVVMLGQDKKGGPGTPFGSNPHFITATGMDRSGNIIIEDPDLPQSSVKYNKNKVMNSMISSVIAGKGRRLYGKGNIMNNAIGSMMNAGVNTMRGITADSIARMAESEQGVTETGDNIVKYSYAYYGHNKGGAAWCCIFVWWVFTMCGARSSFFAALPNKKAQRCQNLADAFKNNNNPAGTWIPLEAMKRGDIKRGDVIFFHSKTGHSGTNHVGIVISDAIQGAKGWQCDTIEGNSTPNNQINGGMVYKWTRYADISRVNSSMEMYGAIRPNYPLAYNASDVLDMSKYGGGNELRVSPEESSGISGGLLGEDSTGTTGGFFEQLAQAGRSMLGAMYGQDKVDMLFGNSTGTTSTMSSSGYNSTGAVNPVDPASLTGNSNAEKIYNYLRAMKYTPAGAAGIMGNLMAESGMNPQNLQNSYEKSFGLNDEQYTKAVDSGQWSKDKFINDSGGYGLAQWTSPGRKQVLYESSVEKGMSVGDLNAQLPVLNSDLNNYPDLVKFLRSTDDVNTASDRVLKEFERPKVLNYDKRREMSNNVYAQFGGKGRGDYVSSTDMMNNYSEYNSNYSKPAVNMTVDRNTDSISVISFLKTIIDVLIKISENTALLKKVLEVLSDKFKIDIDTSDVDQAKLDAKASLNKLMSRSSNNNTNISKLINNKDSQYLINAMMAIASE